MQDKNTFLHYAQIAVPRYTSYPTAADFHGLDAEAHLAALRQIGDENRISVYIHIPYCHAMCLYCGCFTKITNRADILAEYVQCLIAEIKLQASYFKRKPRLAHLHWGGGTPSIISQADFSAVMAALRDNFIFEKTSEHAIELDPRHADSALCAFLAEQGVNRVSLGVQDINAEVQRAIGRIQPLSCIAETVESLRRAGIDHINFDLIYGLPRQTEESLQESCAALLPFAPNRIACYGYAHLPQRRSNQRLIEAASLPDARARMALAARVCSFWKENGYIPIGIDHFALPQDNLAKAAQNGALHRNFQGYTDDNAAVLLGFGASSISEFSHLYTQNIADIGQYKRAISAGRLSVARGIALNAEDKNRAALIGDLMCGFSADLSRYGGKAHFADELQRLRRLSDDNIAALCGETVSATEQGKPFIRIIASIFDSYRQVQPAHFSLSV